MSQSHRHSGLVVALCGLAALAVAMGIGRFAFTPILPMMQADYGLSVALGGWLAAANYVGYLAGSIFATHSRLPARASIRIGLALIACCTMAMAFAHHIAAWLVLRLVPGFASAWVLVTVSTWILPRLAQAKREDLSGMVYAGVGVGIVFAGLVCLVLVREGGSSDAAWILLGLAGVAIAIAVWPVLGDANGVTRERTPAGPQARAGSHARLIFCYGAFGLGYIIPATFLPVMAKQVIADASWFGWAWPIFGAAAVASTLGASRLLHRFTHRHLWIFGNLAMAVGILIPIALPNIAGIAIAALCVGGTFMVNTMSGIHEARRVAGPQAQRLIGAMTSAFAIGQIAGPLLVSGLVRLPNGFSWSLAISAAPLFLAAYMLHAKVEASAPAGPLTAADGGGR